MNKFNVESVIGDTGDWLWCIRTEDEYICDVYAGKAMAELIAECLNHSPEIADELIKLGY